VTAPSIITRPATATERRLVQASWTRQAIRGKRFEVPTFGGSRQAMFRVNRRVYMSEDALYRAHRLLVDDVLSRDGVSVVVGAISSVPEAALGWACAELGLIHFIFVKGECRRNGVGTALLSAAVKLAGPSWHASHLTSEGGNALLKSWESQHGQPRAVVPQSQDQAAQTDL